jgi:WD40 repeat protein
MLLSRARFVLLIGLALFPFVEPVHGQELAPPMDPLPPGVLARFGTLRLRQPYNQSSAVFIAFSPDGKFLASRSDDAAVHLWDVPTGRLLHRFADTSAPTALAFAPDSATLAVAVGDRIRRWDIRTGKPLTTWESQAGSLIYGLTFTPDGKRLISGGSDRAVRVWGVAAGKEVRPFGENLEPIVAVAVAGNGTVAAGGQRGTVYLWDAEGKEIRRLPRDGSRLFGLAFAPDGKTLAVGTRKIIRLWGLADGKELHQCGNAVDTDVTSYNNDIALAFSPDGRFLAALGKTLRMLDLDGKDFAITRGRWTVQLPKRPSSMAFSPDGKQLAIAGGGQEIRFLDATTGQASRRADGHQHQITCVAVSPDGRLVASGSRDHSLFLWDIRTGHTRQRLVGHSSALRALAFSADGTRLVSGDASGAVRAWDIAAGKELHVLQAHVDAVAALVLSPDGKLLATGGEGGGMRLFDLPREKVIHDFPLQRKGTTALAFSADGRLLASADGEGAIRLWQTTTGEPATKPKEDEDNDPDMPLKAPQGPAAPLGRVQWLAFTASQKRLIFWSRQGAYGLWDIAEAKPIRRFDGPASNDCTAALSSDGRTIALCTSDHRLSLRETATGQERALLPGHHQRAIGAIAFSLTGRKLVSGGTDTTALVWDVTGRLRNGQLPSLRLTKPQLDAIWTDLAGDDGGKAFQQMWTAVAAADDVLPYFQERLKPVKVEAKHIEKLIAGLDSNQFPVRNRARMELEELAELAESALKAAAGRKPPLEVRQRLENLLAKIARERHSLNPHRLRVLRAIEVLEQIGTLQARRLLEDLADAPPELRLTDEVKREARASLQRLDRVRAQEGRQRSGQE